MPFRATSVQPASLVAVGDLVVGPHLLEPQRVLWRCPFTAPGHLRFELTGNIRLIVGDGDPLLVTARPAPGDPEWQLRCGCGLAGAAAERQLLLTCPDAPPRDELLSRADRALSAWAQQLSTLTGEDPAEIVGRYQR